MTRLVGAQRALRGSPRAGHLRVARVAYRWVRGTSQNEMDLMYRLSMLEGVAGVREGSWSDDPGQGISKALDTFSQDEVDPAWLSKSNQGVYTTLLRHATSMMRRSGVVDVAERSPTDVLGDLYFGFGPTGSRIDRLFPQIGAKLEDGIRSGDVSPRDATGKAKKYVGNKVLNEIRDYKRSKDRYRQDMSGEGAVGDRGIADKGLWEKSKGEWFARLLLDPSDPLGKKIIFWAHKFLAKQPGGKYLTYWLEESLRQGKPITQVDVAKHFDMASGGLGRYFKPGRSKMQDNFWRSPLADELYDRFVEEGGKRRAARLARLWLLRTAAANPLP
jgi:hypothetical protein